MADSVCFGDMSQASWVCDYLLLRYFTEEFFAF